MISILLSTWSPEPDLYTNQVLQVGPERFEIDGSLEPGVGDVTNQNGTGCRIGHVQLVVENRKSPRQRETGTVVDCAPESAVVVTCFNLEITIGELRTLNIQLQLIIIHKIKYGIF